MLTFYLLLLPEHLLLNYVTGTSIPPNMISKYGVFYPKLLNFRHFRLKTKVQRSSEVSELNEIRRKVTMNIQSKHLEPNILTLSRLFTPKYRF